MLLEEIHSASLKLVKKIGGKVYSLIHMLIIIIVLLIKNGTKFKIMIILEYFIFNVLKL